MNQILQIIGPLLRTKFQFAGHTITVGDLATALLALLLTYVASKLAQRALKARILSRMKLSENGQFLLLRFTNFLVICVGIVVALNILQIQLTSLAMTLGFLSVGIGFGLQNITSNFISGIILLFEQPIRVGDVVTVDDTEGTVHAINVRATLVKTPDNVEIIVPNSKFIESSVINWSYRDRTLRIAVPVGVAYGSDTDLVKQTLIEVASAHPKVLNRPPPLVRFSEFGDSSLNFRLLVWIADPEERFNVGSDLNFAIDAAFRAAGITIPFPQRDVHFPTGGPNQAEDS